MLTKVLEKINKYYFFLVLVAVAMALLVIFIFRSLFQSITTASELDVIVPDSELKVNKENLDKAYKIVFEKETVSLQVQ